MRGGADGGGCFPTGWHYPGIAHLLRVVAAGLVEEISGDCPLPELPLVSLDTETTGRDFQSDRLIELACVRAGGGGTFERQSWLVNPGLPIPAEAVKVHGISDADVRDQPRFEDVACEALEALKGAVPVAYNAEFDRGFLLAAFSRIPATSGRLPPALRKEVVWIDPLVWARELQKHERSRSLGEVCARLGIEIGQAHRAGDDAQAALEVLLAFQREPRVPKTYAAFMQEQQRLARDFEHQRKMWRSRASLGTQ